MSYRPTYYDVLGVGSDASEQEIRAAFRGLALENHPDRFSGDERQQAEEHFQTITEAFNVLSRPDARDRYDRDIYVGSKSKAMDPREISRRLSGKGAQAIRDGKLNEALELLESAVDHDDSNARAHYFLGGVLARAKGHEREALRHLERSAQLEPNNPTILAEAATLAAAAKMSNRARRLAEEALGLDPTNSKALEVLVQLDAEEKAHSGGGLLDRFRRKG